MVDVPAPVAAWHAIAEARDPAGLEPQVHRLRLDVPPTTMYDGRL